MNLKNNSTINRGEDGFEEVLSLIEKKYFHNGGDAEAEVIVNWNKREVKEDKLVSFFATNSALCNAIRRNRGAIMAVTPHPVGATLYFASNQVRPLHTVVKVGK
jgi:hypothetical protein